MSALDKLRKRVHRHGQRLDGIVDRLNRQSDATVALRGNVEQVRAQQAADAGSMGTTVGGLWLTNTAIRANLSDTGISLVRPLAGLVEQGVVEYQYRAVLGPLFRIRGGAS